MHNIIYIAQVDRHILDSIPSFIIKTNIAHILSYMSVTTLKAIVGILVLLSSLFII